MEHLTDDELLATFPEIVEVLPEILAHRKARRKLLSQQIRDKTARIDEHTDDEFSRWFWRRWIMLTDGELLEFINSHIARTERLMRIAEGKPSKSKITDVMIQAARDVPIEDILSGTFRHSGRDLVGLCPFHDERTPSFHIYLAENRGWCFGCNRGGDVIAITMHIYDLTFPEAILYLAGDHR